MYRYYIYLFHENYRLICIENNYDIDYIKKNKEIKKNDTVHNNVFHSDILRAAGCAHAAGRLVISTSRFKAHRQPPPLLSPRNLSVCQFKLGK